MKNLATTLITCVLLLAPLATFAPPLPPPNPDSGGAPIDGGVVLLALIGAAAGSHRISKSKSL